jgi:hypothetical protein
VIEETPFDVLAGTVALAAALGPGWEARRRYNTPEMYRHNEAILSHPGDGIEISVALGEPWRTNRRDRLILFGLLGTELEQPWRLRHLGREITVSTAKTPERMAGDVRRRLLPNLTEILAEARKDKAAQDARVAAQQLLLAELHETLGPDTREGPSRIYSDRTRFLSFGGYSDDVNGQLEIPSGDYAVKFELRIHKRLAVDLARYLAHLRTPGPLDLDCLDIRIVRGSATTREPADQQS